MPAAPDPRLYLTVPADTASDALTAALDAGDVACVLIAGTDGVIAPLVTAAQARGVAALVPDAPETAVHLGADGVHLTSNASVKRTRAALGDGIVGMGCGHSAHAAMVAAEAGADYVAFRGTPDMPDGPPDAELLGWWQLMMTVPCVAMSAPEPDAAGRLAAAGADFVVLDDAVWRHAGDPAQAVRTAQASLTAHT